MAGRADHKPPAIPERVALFGYAGGFSRPVLARLHNELAALAADGLLVACFPSRVFARPFFGRSNLLTSRSATEDGRGRYRSLATPFPRLCEAVFGRSNLPLSLPALYMTGYP